MERYSEEMPAHLLPNLPSAPFLPPPSLWLRPGPQQQTGRRSSKLSWPRLCAPGWKRCDTQSLAQPGHGTFHGAGDLPPLGPCRAWSLPSRPRSLTDRREGCKMPTCPSMSSRRCSEWEWRRVRPIQASNLHSWYGECFICSVILQKDFPRTPLSLHEASLADTKMAMSS